jgi:phosphoribosyl-AMP cyclohydrolase / phosphoribosyl-ATP pyrophosphohydrolase
VVRIEDLNWGPDGLLPAVVQDADSGEVLTVAYVSVESLARTLELGETVFWSRSRQRLWHKGETSGNTQQVVSLAGDCDRDTILIQVRPSGPACHTGARSCFSETVEGFSSAEGAGIGPVLRQLESLIASRKSEKPEGSYTTKLFERGRLRIAQKVGEEAVEAVLAAVGGTREEMVSESADLLYHLLVLLGDLDIPLSEVSRELAKRRK